MIDGVRKMKSLESGSHMTSRHASGRADRCALRTAGAVLALAALLQGCATQPHAGGAQSGPAVHRPGVMTAEQKADFEAAMQLVQKQEYDKAAPLLDKVVQADPDNAIPAIDLALVYEKLGNMKQAEDSLAQALKADPANPVAANEYALLYRRTGRFAEARALYEKTLEKYPHFVMMHKNLAVLCDLYLKDYACALEHYTVYSAANPEDQKAKMWIADLRQRSGK
jgi:tetratricopeptide (TPR) repeat protein